MNDVSPTMKMITHRIFDTLPPAAENINTDRYVDLSIDDNNDDNDFLYANILGDRALWWDKTKALSNLVTEEQCVSHQRMDEGARKLKRMGNIKAIDLLDVGGKKLYFVLT